MRGSRIAYEIVKQQRREKARLKMVLELREKNLKERGGSNGERTEFSIIQRANSE